MADSRPYSAFPSDDIEFEQVVHEALEATQGPDQLRDWLRKLYPNADVHMQDAFGALGGGELKMYVYRDGSPAEHKE